LRIRLDLWMHDARIHHNRSVRPPELRKGIDRYVGIALPPTMFDGEI
jgi:hypothetical protein